MLVLARKKGQVIKLGTDITITVLDIRGDTVRLGIDAPRNLPVHRLEVYTEIERANREAAQSPISLAGLKEFKIHKDS
ncbi:MAG: carbon storage regulator CsrA [Firmicutes bacterium]|nr:carbon storage regulator CsrA [Bacillota bacterium]